MAGLDQFWVCVWQMSWQSAALAVVVLAVNLLLRQAMPASWRCALWLLVAVRLMVPMLPGSSWSVFNLLQPHEAMPVLSHPVGHTTVTVRYGPISSDREQPTVQTLPRIHRSGWMLTGTAIWLLGIFILLGRQIVNEWRGAMMEQNMPRITETRVLEMVERCRQKMNLWRRVRAVSSTIVRTPAICGFWRATLILPAENQLSADELEMVIFHELAHVRRFDLQIDRLLSILRAVHWFNPISWLLLRYWRSEREMACDETVLRIVGENQRTEYGLVILDMVERFSTLQPAAGAVGLFESSSDLHRRIRMIGSYNPSRIRWVAGMFIALGIAGCLLTDAKAEDTTAPTATMVQPPAADDGESTRVYDISDLVVRHTSFSKFTNVPTDDFENLPPSKPDPKKIAEQHAKAVQSIIEAIHDTVPNSWKDKGGNGVITQILGQDQLIISQTEDCHDKIDKMLAIMRHIANRQVNLEAHFLVLDDEVLKKAGIVMRG
jgi:beta-lactamase regulating signal transducer with metallopeptidase domain